MKQHHNQSGALLIEVLAVLGLIGMMAPFLYKQALERNREVSNIAIAGEMRTVTEALRTAIEVDFMSHLQDGCPTLGNSQLNTTRCTDLDDYLPVAVYLPDGAALDSYRTQVWCKNTLETCTCSVDQNPCIDNNGNNPCLNRGNTEYSYSDPICFGVITSVEDNLPQNLTLRRARRIASLIGSSGGVCTATNKIDGTMGGWSLNNTTAPGLDCDTDNDLGLAATTGIITEAIGTGEIVGQAATENITAIPPNVAFERLHAWDYFSVGDATNNNPNRDCFVVNRNVNNPAGNNGDTIFHTGETNDQGNPCDPLFWVGTKGDANDTSTAGNVYVRNSLIVGRDNTGDKHAIEMGEQTNNGNSSGVITVFNTTGNATQTIQLRGATDTTPARITLTDAVYNNEEHKVEITSSNDGDHIPQIKLIEQTNPGGNEVGTQLTSRGLEDLSDSTYKVDPRFTSRMTDIEIGARGNARLSQILPNYILKNVVSITGSGSIDVPTSTDTPSANELTCPTGYNRVLVVIPTGGTSVELATDTITKQKEDVPVSVDTETGQGTLTIPELTPTENALVNGYPAVQIENASHHHQKVEATENADQWTVTLGYCTDKNCNSFTEDDTNTMTAIAHVYCVYTGNGTIDAPTDIPANAQLTRNAE